MNYNLSGRNLIIVELFVKVELSMKALKGDVCSIYIQVWDMCQT